MKTRLLAVAIAGTSLCGTALAAPFSPFDVRAAGMGGTGVASAKSASAALFNPAMLSAQVEGDKFQFVLGAGAAVSDTENLFDRVDSLQQTLDDVETLTTAITGLNINANTYYPQLAQLANLTTQVAGDVAAMNNDALLAGAGTGLGVGVPGPRVGVGVFVTGNATAVVSPQVNGADISELQRYASVLSDGQVTSLELGDIANDFLSGGAADIDVSDFTPQSTADGTALAVVEYGIALSHRYDLASGGMLSVGVAPKALEVSTFDYTADLESFDDANIDASNSETTDSGFDVDVGVVYRASATGAWQYGLTVKNLIGNDFKTKLGRTLEVPTQVRAGVARMTERSTLAVDLDLVKNDGVQARGDTQFLAFGAEYDLKYLQLRGGLRFNLADSDIDDALSLGLGLGPVDLSVIGNQNDVGASLQLGFGW